MHTDNTTYNTRPNYPLVNGKLSHGYEALAQHLLAEFSDTFEDDTKHSRFHVLNLVEGVEVLVEWDTGDHPLHYAETIVIPAATGRYRLRNRGQGICKVVKAFVK